MNSKELKEKISEISNSEFPLIDFFNDIGWLEIINLFDTEKAYEDIEKIYNVFVHYIDKAKQLEKENQELRKAVKSWNENGGKLIRENTKLKKALDILKQKGNLVLVEQKYLGDDYDIYLVCYFLSEVTKKYKALKEISKEEYELLKSVLEEE